MGRNVRKWFELSRGPSGDRGYRRLAPLVLVNGLAEQAESWFHNRRALARDFDVKVPELLVYNGPLLHGWIRSGGVVTVDYLVERLARFLDEFVQRPPYHLVGSSLGGQVALTFAARRPDQVAKLVLIAPSGFHGAENLPMIEGVRRGDYGALVRSVFHDPRRATADLVTTVRDKFQDRRWKLGVLRTLRGTAGHSVAPLLPLVDRPALVIWGAEDRVLSDVSGSIQAARRLPRALQVVVPRCGHAPQIERPRLVNQLIVRFLRDELASVPPVFAAGRSF